MEPHGGPHSQGLPSTVVTAGFPHRTRGLDPRQGLCCFPHTPQQNPLPGLHALTPDSRGAVQLSFKTLESPLPGSSPAFHPFPWKSGPLPF